MPPTSRVTVLITNLPPHAGPQVAIARQKALSETGTSCPYDPPSRGRQPPPQRRPLGLSLVVCGVVAGCRSADRSEEHTSELQSLMRISSDVFCLKNKTYIQQ